MKPIARVVFGLSTIAPQIFAAGPDFTPPTPLLRALLHNDTAQAKRLLREGANPNEGRLYGFAPIYFPIFNHNVEVFDAMISKGADVKVVDAFGSSTLMWAAADEAARPALVEKLLNLGVDPELQNKLGETAMTWALRRGQTSIVNTLSRAGEDPNARLRKSVETAIALLQKSAEQFVRVSGCSSCHHQSLPQMAISAARSRGFAVDEAASQRQREAVIAAFRPLREAMLKGTERIPAPGTGLGYALVGLAAEGQLPDDVTTAMAHHLAAQQKADGRVWSIPARPPMESSEISGTALFVRAMETYGDNAQPAVAKAREWLVQAVPRTSEEYSMRLLGLAWSKAEQTELRRAVGPILSQQRPDGGWAQLPSLESDAYATGQALVALYESNQLKKSDEAFRRGVAFLLRTQFPDGSWMVRTRSFPLQPLKDSGFPHDRNQWSSAAGTSWAAMALSLAAPAVIPSVEEYLLHN